MEKSKKNAPAPKKYLLIEVAVIVWVLYFASQHYLLKDKVGVPEAPHAKAHRDHKLAQSGQKPDGRPQKLPQVEESRLEAPPNLDADAENKPPSKHDSVIKKCDALLAADAQGDTKYYSMSDLQFTNFSDELDYKCRGINSGWKRKGWSLIDKEDISDCCKETPECHLWNKVCAEPEKPFRKCCVEHKKLRDTALWVASKLDGAKIRYFLSTGSAIGAYRHNGTIIPWDTDVDMAIYPEDKDKMIEVFGNQKAHFFHKDKLGKDMYWVHASANGKPIGGPHVEVFFDKAYTSKPDTLVPFQRCDYYGHVGAMNCPNTKALDAWFPSGWRHYGGAHFHNFHRCTKYDKGKRIELERC